MRTLLARSAGLFAVWVVLIRSAQPADLVVGAITVALATWMSLRLLSPDAGRIRLGALAARLPRFLWQSVRAGIDGDDRVVRKHHGTDPVAEGGDAPGRRRGDLGCRYGLHGPAAAKEHR